MSMCRIQVTHFSLIENSFGNLHHLPAYPAGPWGWVYGKELSSFVFYTGTRSIRNDAHGRKNGDHQSSKDRVPLLHYTIDGRAKSTNAPAKLSRPLIWGPNCRRGEHGWKGSRTRWLWGLGGLGGLPLYLLHPLYHSVRRDETRQASDNPF